MSTISVIIPVWNIQKRGYERIDLSLFSIQRNSRPPEEVVIVDGSEPANHARLKAITDKYPFVRLAKLYQPIMNLSALWNRGAMLTSSNYLFVTGADFIYGPGFFQLLRDMSDKSLIILASVIMGGPNAKIDQKAIALWNSDTWQTRKEPEDIAEKDWPTWGKYAPGLQLFSRDFFAASNGLDEKYVGPSAMDNDLLLRAQIYGLTKHYTGSSNCWHIYHPPFKNRMGKLIDQNHQRLHYWKKRHETGAGSPVNWRMRDK